MLKPEENERLTRVGPRTPMGRLLRRYWQPACLSEELPENDGAPIRVRLLGEDLVAYRASDGAVGLVDAYCPHRRAPMFFGRNEDCGLRCVYHGWKFDARGACVDMPSEPPDSLFRHKVTMTAYPTWEAGGIVWAYLGPSEHRPALPESLLVRAPQTHRFASKTFQSCNWVQALEGGVDSVHFTFLHNMNVGQSGWLLARPPDVEFAWTEYGHAGLAIHHHGDRDYVRSFHYVLPAQSIRSRTIGPTGEAVDIPTVTAHIWDPIDDESCWVYNYGCSYDEDKPITTAFRHARETLAGRGPQDMLPGYLPKRNRSNDYGLDRTVQKTKTFTGIPGVNTQDFAVQENMAGTMGSPGIVDRSREHLAESDRVIIGMRRLLFEALNDLEEGRMPRAVDPITYRDIRPGEAIVAAGTPWHVAFTHATGEVLVEI